MGGQKTPPTPSPGLFGRGLPLCGCTSGELRSDHGDYRPGNRRHTSGGHTRAADSFGPDPFRSRRSGALGGRGDRARWPQLSSSTALPCNRRDSSAWVASPTLFQSPRQAIFGCRAPAATCPATRHRAAVPDLAGQFAGGAGPDAVGRLDRPRGSQSPPGADHALDGANNLEFCDRTIREALPQLGDDRQYGRRRHLEWSCTGGGTPVRCGATGKW